MKRNFILLFAISILFLSCENSLFTKAAKIYKVKFSTNGGTPIEDIYTNEITESPHTEKSDFDFLGWYLTSDFSDDAVVFPLEISQSITLYAKWGKTYNAIFSVNGGTQVTDRKVAMIDESPVTIKDGFSFAGWYLNPDFSGERVSFPYELKSDTIFFAKWVRKYIVTFETDGGSSISPQETGFIEKEPETKKDNYTFSGWYLDGAFAKRVEFPLDVTENITLHAKWIPVSWDNDYALMIDVEGGKFTMGDDTLYNGGAYSTGPAHQVTISSFRIAAYELTYEIWSEVYSWAIQNGYVLEDAQKGVTDQDKFSDFEPATKISWNMAIVWLNAYSEMKGLEPVYKNNNSICRDYETIKDLSVEFDKNANGYRLPTDAEWEYAAGGGNYEYRDTYSYAGSNDKNEVAWTGETETHPVGTKKANHLGIYDMSGNVAEWCWDAKYKFSTDAVSNPVSDLVASPSSSRTVRGGSYDYRSSGYMLYIRYREISEERTAVQNRYTEGGRYYYYGALGLRIAQNSQ